MAAAGAAGVADAPAPNWNKLDDGNEGVLATGAAAVGAGAPPNANDVDLAGAAVAPAPPPNLKMSVEADDV